MTNRGDVQPLINFKNLKGFRAFSEDGKIETILFLDAAKEIVAQIGEYLCSYSFNTIFFEEGVAD